VLRFGEFADLVSRAGPENALDVATLGLAEAQSARAGVLKDPMLAVTRDDVPVAGQWREKEAMAGDAPTGVAPSWRLAFTQSFPWPGTLAREKQAAAAATDATRIASDASRAARRFAAMELYLNMIRLQKAIKVQKAVKVEADAFRDFVHERYRQGIGAHLEFLQTHTESVVIGANIASLSSELANLTRHARLLLTGVSGLDVEHVGFQLEWPADFLKGDGPAIVPQDQSPDYTKASIGQIREREVAGKEAAYDRTLPAFTLSGMAMRDDMGMRSIGAMAGVTVPLYSHTERAALAAESALVKARADQQLSWYEKTKQLALAQTTERMQRLSANLSTLYKDILPAVREHLEVAEVAYGQGKGAVTSIIEGRRELLNLEMARLSTEEALAQAHLAFARVEAGFVDQAIDAPIPAIPYAPMASSSMEGAGPAAKMGGKTRFGGGRGRIPGAWTGDKLPGQAERAPEEQHQPDDAPDMGM